MKLAFHNILWPTDFSTLSIAAARVARDMAQQFKAKMHVLHVEPILVPDSTMALETGGDLLVGTTNVSRTARPELDRIVRECFGDNPDILREVRIGTPWHEICDYANANSIDLIVISTHGHTGFQHVLLGSVAERVVQHAPCAVFVVKVIHGAHAVGHKGRKH